MKLRLEGVRRVGSRGFTLIELMIVVAIIATLASIALPAYRTYICKSKQSEAKVNLASIRTMELAYYGNHDRFAALPITGCTALAPPCTSLFPPNLLGWEPMANVRYYYFTPYVSPDSFVAYAVSHIVSNSGGPPDIWATSGSLLDASSASVTPVPYGPTQTYDGLMRVHDACK